MKRNFSLKKTLGRKNLILAIVALVLIMVTAIGASFSWIEEVSQVDFASNNGQQTPMHIDSKLLKSNAEVDLEHNGDTINLKDYFFESGDMHLSPCIGDGTDFYFPVEKKTEGANTNWRIGKKDDANVNYLSATFRVRSKKAGASFWFEKTPNKEFISFKKGENNAADIKERLRISVSVDGTTNVYALNNSGQYKTISSGAETTVDGRKMEDYIHYEEAYRDNNPKDYYKDPINVTNKPNQGGGDNLNGNVLFEVPQYKSSKSATTSKIVTVKLWLEYDSSNKAAALDLSDINLNLVSSWAKTRRIYVHDKTFYQDGYDHECWLTQSDAGLFWQIDGEDPDKYFPLTRVSGTEYYYANIPASYNNAKVTLRRRSSTTWDGGANWDSWATTFPNNYHSAVYTVFSKNFGTWNEDDVSQIYFLDSAPLSTPKAYMWDSKTIFNSEDINGKAVRNANWPGIDLDKYKNANSYKGWKFETSVDDNCTLTATNAGYYTFTLHDVSEGHLVLVTYSPKGSPVTGNSSWKVHINTSGNNWPDYTMKKQDSSLGNTYTTTIYLTQGTHKFKLKTGNDWYGNSGTITDTNENDSNALSFYNLFYTADFDYMVLSDGVADGENKEYQTQDLMVFDIDNPTTGANWRGKTFDMATLTWFDATPTNKSNLPMYTGSNTYLHSNISTGTNPRWNSTRFAYGGQYVNTNGNAFYHTKYDGSNDEKILCKRYVKSPGDYEFCVRYKGDWYKTDKDHRNVDCNYNDNTYEDSMTVYKEDSTHSYNVIAKNLEKDVYRFYFMFKGGYNGYPLVKIEKGGAE